MENALEEPSDTEGDAADDAELLKRAVRFDDDVRAIGAVDELLEIGARVDLEDLVEVVTAGRHADKQLQQKHVEEDLHEAALAS